MKIPRKQETSLLRPLLASILGIGLPFPLLVRQSLITDALLGLIAALSLFCTAVVVAIVGPRLAKNSRTGIALLTAGGIVTIAAIAARAIPLHARIPVETLAPLLLFFAAVAVDRGVYAVKQGFTHAFIDSIAVAACFTALLCGAAGLQHDIGKFSSIFAARIPGFDAVRFFIELPGILLIIACGAAVVELLSRQKQEVVNDQ